VIESHKITCARGFSKARRLGYVGASTELGKLRPSKEKTTSKEKNCQGVQAEDVAEERNDAASRLDRHSAPKCNLLRVPESFTEASMRRAFRLFEISINADHTDQFRIEK